MFCCSVRFVCVRPTISLRYTVIEVNVSSGLATIRMHVAVVISHNWKSHLVPQQRSGSLGRHFHALSGPLKVFCNGRYSWSPSAIFHSDRDGFIDRATCSIGLLRSCSRCSVFSSLLGEAFSDGLIIRWYLSCELQEDLLALFLNSGAETYLYLPSRFLYSLCWSGAEVSFGGYAM